MFLFHIHPVSLPFFLHEKICIYILKIYTELYIYFFFKPLWLYTFDFHFCHQNKLKMKCLLIKSFNLYECKHRVGAAFILKNICGQVIFTFLGGGITGSRINGLGLA